MKKLMLHRYNDLSHAEMNFHLVANDDHQYSVG